MKAMVHFKLNSKEDTVKHMLQFSGQLSQVKNYFVLNDIAAQVKYLPLLSLLLATLAKTCPYNKLVLVVHRLTAFVISVSMTCCLNFA